MATMACQVLTIRPAMRDTATIDEVIRAARFRRAYFVNRYRADGGQACTG
jgi:hypothetical protein